MKKSFVILFVLGLVVSSFAQLNNIDESWKEKSNISAQHKAFKEGLYKYKEHYFFTEAQLNDYYKSLSDTVSELKKNLAQQSQTINELRNTITDLEEEHKSISVELEQARNEGESISVLGALVNKSTFASVMWFIVFALILLAGVGFFMYQRSNVVTRQTRRDFEELNNEFEEHRKSTLERERKLRRELQDYINKFEEMKVKGRL